MTPSNKQARPAETGGAIAAAACAIALAAGADEATIGAIGIAAGLIPGAITALVANGGLRGVLRKLIGR